MLSLLSEQASGVQHKGGSIHRAQPRAPVLSNPKEKSMVCECDPSVPAPLHLSTLLSCHFYRRLNTFVRSLFISVWISAPPPPPPPPPHQRHHGNGRHYFTHPTIKIQHSGAHRVYHIMGTLWALRSGRRDVMSAPSVWVAPPSDWREAAVCRSLFCVYCFCWLDV